MRIAVFGSTGRTGRHLVVQGLERGHEIVAFTRRPHLLGDRSRLAAVVGGDGRDFHAVRQAVAGADAVISVVPGGSRRDPHQAADVTRTIIRAMIDAGVRRLVVTSAYPIVAERPRLVVAVLRRLLATAYADVKAMEAIVATSDVDWTIVRLNRLTNGTAGVPVLTSQSPLARPRAITRPAAAATLLDIAEDTGLARAAINMSGGPVRVSRTAVVSAAVLLAAAAAGGLRACVRSEPSGNVSRGPGGREAIRIVAVDRAFEPGTVWLQAGKEVTVEITNRGAQPHDFAIRALELNTGLLKPGEVATATFAVPPETIQFVCTIHRGMRGTIRAR